MRVALLGLVLVAPSAATLGLQASDAAACWPAGQA